MHTEITGRLAHLPSYIDCSEGTLVVWRLPHSPYPWTAQSVRGHSGLWCCQGTLWGGWYLSLVWLFKVCLPCSAPKVTFVVLIGYVYVTLMILPSRSWKSTMRITSQWTWCCLMTLWSTSRGYIVWFAWTRAMHFWLEWGAVVGRVCLDWQPLLQDTNCLRLLWAEGMGRRNSGRTWSSFTTNWALRIKRYCS